MTAAGTQEQSQELSLAACSCMTLTSETGKHYWFRTCDIETDIWKDGAHVVNVPAKSKLTFTVRGEEESKFAFTGITYNQSDTWLLDGVNQEGLTGGLLMLYEGTSVDKAEAGYEGYMGMEIVTKLLSSCANVEEVIKMAETMQVLNIPIGDRHVSATMHCFFTDVTGNEVVLEAADNQKPGIFTIYKKKDIIGVMTNSPIYSRHLENLSWYISQSPELKQGLNGRPVDKLILDGREVKGNSRADHLSANGTFPASYCSYDRFIRVAVLKALNYSGNRFPDDKMLAMGSNIMNAVNEPHSQGIYHYTRIEKDGRVIGQKDSCTQYLVMYDLSEKAFYIKALDVVSWTKYQLISADNTDNIMKYNISHDGMAGILEGN